MMPSDISKLLEDLAIFVRVTIDPPPSRADLIPGKRPNISNRRGN
jgi:hypothetical protein